MLGQLMIIPDLYDHHCLSNCGRAAAFLPTSSASTGSLNYHSMMLMPLTKLLLQVNVTINTHCSREELQPPMLNTLAVMRHSLLWLWLWPRHMHMPTSSHIFLCGVSPSSAMLRVNKLWHCPITGSHTCFIIESWGLLLLCTHYYHPTI
jgi:hypothetical protein